MKKRKLVWGLLFLSLALAVGACSNDNNGYNNTDYSNFAPGTAVTVQTDNFKIKYGDGVITKTAWNTGEDEVVATATAELGNGLSLHADLVDEGTNSETRSVQSISANNVVVLCYGGPMDANHGANACKKAPVSGNQFSIQPGSYTMMFYAHSNGAPSLSLNSGTDVGNPANGTYLSYNADFKETNSAGVNAMYNSASVKVNDNGSVEVNGGSATDKISGITLAPLYSQVKITCASGSSLSGISAIVTGGASASSEEIISRTNVTSNHSGTSSQAITFSGQVSNGTDEGYINVIPGSGHFKVDVDATLGSVSYSKQTLEFNATLQKGHRYNITATINRDYAVTAVAGANGKVSLTGGTVEGVTGGYKATTSDANQNFTATATPNSGYKFVRWDVSGGGTVSDNPFTDKISNQNGKTLTAVFEASGSGARVVTASIFYKWGATESFETTSGGVGVSSKNVPNAAPWNTRTVKTALQLQGYINQTFYWDDGIGDESTGKQTIIFREGTEPGGTPKDVIVNCGIWVKKNAPAASSFEYAPATGTPNHRSPVILTEANAASIRLSGEYIFLPAFGDFHREGSINKWGDHNDNGSYWSSTYGDYYNSVTHMYHGAALTFNKLAACIASWPSFSPCVANYWPE